MTGLRWVVRIGFAAVALHGLQAVVQQVIPVPERGPQQSEWLFHAIAATFLVWIAARSVWTGWRLAAAVFAIFFGVTFLTSLVEGAVFGFVPWADAVPLGAAIGVTALLFAPVAVAAAGRARAAPVTPPEPSPLAPLAPTTAFQWLARIAGCSALYVLVYLLAGMIIFPYVKEVYAEMGLPPVGAMVLLQLLVRGPIFVGACILVVGMTAGSRIHRALVAGAMMAVLGGILPLFVPNPYIPEAIRWVHFFEVVTSNFLFGLATGWAFAARPATSMTAAGTPADTRGAMGSAAVGGAALLAAASLLWFPHPASAQVALEGQWVYAAEISDDIEAAVGRSVAGIPFAFRTVARNLLRRANIPP
jgi:hypothetical protein